MHKIISIIIAAICCLTLLNGCGKKVSKNIRCEVEFITEPAGAEILTLSNKNIGTAPFKIKLRPNRYIVKVMKDKYRPVWRSFRVMPNAKKTVRIKLQPVTGALLIKSRPPGAKVAVNQQEMGLTPLVVPRLPLGQYTIATSKTGYAARETKTIVKNARPREIMISLDSNIGKILVKSTPSRARVYLNGDSRGYTPFKAELESGKYKLEIIKNGYAKLQDTVLVDRDKTINKNYLLNLLPCKVSVTSNPNGAAIFIDNKPYGNTPLRNLRLSAGKHSIRAEKCGFDPFSKEFYATPGKNIIVTMPLIGNTGGADVVINPPGTTVYFNGKRYCITKPSDTEGISEVIKFRNITAGKYLITAAHKLAVPHKKSITVTIRKGKVVRPKPILLWVPNAEMKLFKHPRILGILIREYEDKVYFSPEPGIKMEYKRSEIEYLKRLKKDEDGNIICK
ncbi:PEGA domain-containing protein [Lentisphaerota bacterium ZTH]|nr:PEGA domain-containing protein [Lentisphaerota bacterium]WET06856.1 PEGA domain-containing protein [Lentisphaerota bacterium ZTH]